MNFALFHFRSGWERAQKWGSGGGPRGVISLQSIYVSTVLLNVLTQGRTSVAEQKLKAVHWNKLIRILKLALYEGVFPLFSQGTPVALWYKDALLPSAITRKTKRIGFPSHTGPSLALTCLFALQSAKQISLSPEKSRQSHLSAPCCTALEDHPPLWQKIRDDLLTTHYLATFESHK